MPNQEQLKNAGREALIAEARAGIRFESDNIEAELNACVARISRTVRAYRKASHSGEADAISDVLHDLRCYCDSKSLVFSELDAAACAYYLEDVRETPWISRPPVPDHQDKRARP